MRLLEMRQAKTPHPAPLKPAVLLVLSYLAILLIQWRAFYKGEILVDAVRRTLRVALDNITDYCGKFRPMRTADTT